MIISRVHGARLESLQGKGTTTPFLAKKMKTSIAERRWLKGSREAEAEAEKFAEAAKTKAVTTQRIVAGIIVDEFDMSVMTWDGEELVIREQMVCRVKAHDKTWEVRPNHVRNLAHLFEEAEQLHTGIRTPPEATSCLVYQV